eukprot:PhM_4_TR7008/c0_g1_i1/m.39508
MSDHPSFLTQSPTSEKEIQRERRAQQIYHKLLSETNKVNDALATIDLLTANHQKNLATEHWKRIYYKRARCGASGAGNVFQDDSGAVHIVRMQSKLNRALDHCLGHLGTDTAELSALRMRDAAMRALLYHEAIRMQREEEARLATDMVSAASRSLRSTSGSTTAKARNQTTTTTERASVKTLIFHLETFDVEDAINRLRTVSSKRSVRQPSLANALTI